MAIWLDMTFLPYRDAATQLFYRTAEAGELAPAKTSATLSRSATRHRPAHLRHATDLDHGLLERLRKPGGFGEPETEERVELEALLGAGGLVDSGCFGPDVGSKQPLSAAQSDQPG